MARKPTSPKPAPAMTDLVTVLGPANGRRRAGRRFGPEPVVIPVADLDEDDLEALQGDPALIVSIAPAPEDDSSQS